MLTSRTLIIGAAAGYDEAQLRPFARSLLRSGYQGDVHLLVGANHLAARRAFDGLPLSLTKLSRARSAWADWLQSVQYHGVSRRLHRVLSRLSQRRPRLSQLTGLFLHPSCMRYPIFAALLRRIGSRYSHVLHTDVRDVIFQRDPLDPLPEVELGLVLEHRDVRFGAEPVNDDWLQVMYGSDATARLHGKPISCSGVSIGSARGMARYFEQMSAELIGRLGRHHGAFGFDQAAQNYLLYQERLTDVSVFEHGDGRVAHLKMVPDEELRLAADGHTVLNNAGEPFALVHQGCQKRWLDQRMRVAFAGERG